ncbi:hypothetical protein CEUSTIGMA_g871.t1 [Chlamydomonas eustigma]|uniref:Uncharacterized protein n=1 Tax=Chlamydomonas eustigma TaxID=1157962 RepID=A0A250WRU5_9CHLO|nr:hypothetical protein CEUSTIGMA_g871.t1 [Chlamydomonas eustigma]|eukprot:GAX73419.1 hypothetical protein CEUSTIGMA_g871.t1 [Chlamydomonas eustigma]
MKTLSDYINWRVKEPPVDKATWRPPTLPVLYDKPQTDLHNSLDTHPIINRVLRNPKLPPPRAFPIWGSPAFQFFAGLWTGAMVTFLITSKPLGRKEVEDLVKYDPAYFPEFAKPSQH